MFSFKLVDENFVRKWNCPKILTINEREYTLKDLCRNRNVLKQDCVRSVFTPYGPPEGEETEDEKKMYLSQEDRQEMDNKDDEEQQKINEVHACEKKTMSLEECTEKRYHLGSNLLCENIRLQVPKDY